MNTTTGDSKVVCDKCGRPIPFGKGYIVIDGWNICGLCQYEDQQKRVYPPIRPTKIVKEEPKWEISK